MKNISNKTKKMLEIEKREGEKIEEILRIKYVDEKKSINQICKELRISYVTLFKWLEKAGIYSRGIL